MLSRSIISISDGLWIHCKNHEFLIYLSMDYRLNIFWHTEGNTLSSHGFLMTAPGFPVDLTSVAFMPELARGWDYSKAYAVCTDYLK